MTQNVSALLLHQPAKMLYRIFLEQEQFQTKTETPDDHI